MSKCIKCGEEINLTIFGCSEEICWGCLNKTEKEKVIENNLNNTLENKNEPD